MTTLPSPPTLGKPATEAKHLFGVYTAGTGNMDKLWGKSKASCRAHILSALEGKRVPNSKAAWGVFRKAMLALYGISGECMAEEDDQLRNAVKWEATP